MFFRLALKQSHIQVVKGVTKIMEFQRKYKRTPHHLQPYRNTNISENHQRNMQLV